MRFLAPLVFVTAAAFAADPSTGKKLVFSDDFNGDKLDESKWIVTGSKETISFVKFGKESALRIGLKMGTDMIQTNSVSTRGKFSQQYGYFEASMRMNATEGHVGIFRIASDDEKTTPSISLSFHASGKDRVNPWARASMESGQQDFRPEKPNPPMKSGDVSKKFHTYGFLWTEKAYTWYFNGKAVHKLDKPEVKEPMYLSLSHWVSDFERKDLVPSKLPDDVEVDWVKVWK